MEDFLRIPIQIGRDGIITEYAIEHGKSFVPKWSNEWNILSNDDLICYFKGVVLLEEFLFPGGIGLGSATSTKFIYRTIQERHLDDNMSLAQWSFEVNTNSYCPFDGRSGRTVQEHFQNIRKKAFLQAQEINDAIKRKEEKKKQKAEAHAERLRQKEIRDKELGYK